MAPLTDTEFEQLSKKVKSCTWLIKAEFSENCQNYSVFSSGIAVNPKQYKGFPSSGEFLLLTSARAIRREKKQAFRITVRNFGGNDFLHARELTLNSQWNLALLAVKCSDHVRYGEFVKDWSVSKFQTLVQIAHSEESADAEHFEWSLFVGRASFPCVNRLPPLCKTTCADYVCSSLEKTPEFRTLGDIFNKDSFKNHIPPLPDFPRKLLASVPIIQCAGLSSCGGSPVFNTNGEIVGIMIHKVDDCQIAVHVSLLVTFLANTKDESKSEGASKGGGASRGGGTSKGARKWP